MKVGQIIPYALVKFTIVIILGTYNNIYRLLSDYINALINLYLRENIMFAKILITFKICCY